MKAVGKPVEVDFYEIQSWDPQNAEGNWIAHCSEGKASIPSGQVGHGSGSFGGGA